METLAGDRDSVSVPGYVIEESLGEGGMGSVHAATRHGIPVAIKVLRSDLDGEEFLRRFAREREILARIAISLRMAEPPKPHAGLAERGRMKHCPIPSCSILS